MMVDRDQKATESACIRDNADSLKAIILVSKNSFQNQLIKLFLENRMAEPCAIHLQSEWFDVMENSSDTRSLALLDCFDIFPADLWKKIGMGGGPDPSEQALALFNVRPDSGSDFEFDAIEHRVRGVFYLDERPERLAKGVEKILCGELWFSRKTTSKLLMDTERFRPRSNELETMLTAREKEILTAIASGSANIEISEEFHISLNTVKTHIYNIYKKIDVRNRLEATLWVARYL